MGVGGWVGPGLTRKYFFAKLSQNSPILIFCGSIPCVFGLYTYVHNSY